MSRKIDRTVHANSDFLRQVFNKTWILNCSGTPEHPYLRFSWCSGQSAQRCHCFHLHCHSTLKEKGEGRMGYNRSPLSRHWDLTHSAVSRKARQGAKWWGFLLPAPNCQTHSPEWLPWHDRSNKSWIIHQPLLKSKHPLPFMHVYQSLLL